MKTKAHNSKKNIMFPYPLQMQGFQIKTWNIHIKRDKCNIKGMNIKRSYLLYNIKGNEFINYLYRRNFKHIRNLFRK